MKTDQEILDRMEAVKENDLFGAQRGDLVGYLSYDAAKPFLVEGATPDDWKVKSQDVEAIKADMRSYLPFAWDKANNQRGLSSSRSIDHMRAWLWLAGEADLLARMDSTYEFYGKPCLVLCSEWCGFDWRAEDDGDWTNHEGEPGTTAERGLARHGIQVAA